LYGKAVFLLIFSKLNSLPASFLSKPTACRRLLWAFNKGQGGHGLPFSAISCRFTPSTQTVWLLHRVGITFAVMGMRSRRFGVLSTN
jgi:hypothetical protein